MSVSFTSVNQNPTSDLIDNAIKQRQQAQVQSQSKEEVAANPQSTDTVDISSKKKEKTSLWQKFKNGYTSVKKGFVRMGYYTVGTVKGLLYGGATACCVLGADAIRGIVKKAEKPNSKGGMILAGVAGLAVLAGNIFNANLKANARNAEIDHRWQTGHNRMN